MDDLTEKLQVLLPHWIAHNKDHGQEFAKWAALAETQGQNEVASLIAEAAAILDKANHNLTMALARLGGNPKHPGHQHGNQ